MCAKYLHQGEESQNLHVWHTLHMCVHMHLLDPTSKCKREREVSGACFKVMVTHTHIRLTYKHNHTHPHLHTHYTLSHIYSHIFCAPENKTSLYVKVHVGW